MKHYISQNEIFITYENRSADKYHKDLTDFIRSKYSAEDILKNELANSIITDCYEWCAKFFYDIITQIDDFLFASAVFIYHESSMHLYTRVLRAEDIGKTININEESLALNRRIFKLILEQTCDVNYKSNSSPNKDLLEAYDKTIEDLLFLGSELYSFASFLAESRMISNTYYISINENNLLAINRPPVIEAIFVKIYEINNEDFRLGIMDDNGANDFKLALKKCMNIDYDFAGGQIEQIKKKLNPTNSSTQTIEPGTLVLNLKNNGVSEADAQNFYDGLTLSSKNKLKVTDSIYRVNSMERHFFRPILTVNHNGKERHLIGIEKWKESIMVLATNNFQWNKASDEWKRNECFNEFLDAKSTEHDKHLENEVEKTLKSKKIPFIRNATHFTDGKSNSVNIITKGVGEMDFVWLDTQKNKIIVADCKYNRARYDMIAFSADYTNFVNSYEQKLRGKINWIVANKELVGKHITNTYPGLSIDITNFDIEGIFIINTPTFYMFNGSFKTVCFFRLEDFINENYQPPTMPISIETTKGHKIKIIEYPYFSPKNLA